MSKAIGIDLGTTFTCVAYMKTTDLVEIVQNNEGEKITPSVVHYGRITTIGGEAVKMRGKDPKNTVFQVKRFMGREADDEEVMKRNYPFEIVQSAKGNLNIRVTPTSEGEPITYKPEAISSDILKYAKGLAEASLGHTVTDAVITIPANFNGSQRQATKDAGELAGLNVLRIINEPTAAALAYGFNKRKNKEKRVVLVYDLGGGTFDVSIVEIEGTESTVKSTEGLTYLGGEDFDYRLYEEAVSEFKKIGVDVPEANKFALQQSCERAKKSLSVSLTAEVEAIDRNGNRKTITIKRETFEELCEDLFDKTIECVKDAIKESECKISEIDDVVLVGGSSRIPRVRTLLQEIFGEKKLKFDIPPDHAVAHGAAILAESLSGGTVKGGSVKLVDVVPLTLGLAVRYNQMSALIWRNSRYPTSHTEIFINSHADTTSLAFKIYQGQYALASNNHLLATLDISCPPRPEGENKMETTFSIDENCILHMHVKDLETQKEANITVKTNTLTEKEMSDMVKFAAERAAEEKIQIEKMNARTAFGDAITKVKVQMRKMAKGAVWTALHDLVLTEEEWIHGKDPSNESLYEHAKLIRSTLNRLIAQEKVVERM